MNKTTKKETEMKIKTNELSHEELLDLIDELEKDRKIKAAEIKALTAKLEQIGVIITRQEEHVLIYEEIHNICKEYVNHPVEREVNI